MDERLRRLSELLRQRDLLDAEIAAITGRSARPGDVGEFIAAAVFDIALAPTATQPGFDGTFHSGPLAGRTVNVKAYGDASTGLDISDHVCDFYLVLSGGPQPTGSSRRRPWHIAATAWMSPASRVNGGRRLAPGVRDRPAMGTNVVSP